MGAVLETMIDDLRQLVEAESPSSDPQLLARSAEVVADLIERHLGTRPTLIDEGAGPHVHWTGGGDPKVLICLLYTSPSPRDLSTSRMPSSA